MEVRIIQFDRIKIVALSDEKIFPSVVIVVKEMDTPARVNHCHLPYSGCIAGIGEGAVSVVLVESVALICQVGHYDVRPSIVIVIREIHAHASVGTPIDVNRNFGGQADLFKCAISLVVIKELNHRIIGHKKIDLAVTIVVGDRKPKPFPRFTETHLLCDLGKRSILIIVVHEWGNGLEEIRMAVCAIAFLVLAAPDIVEIPIQIAEDNEIEEPVPVEIDPRGARGPTGSSDARDR